MKYTPGPWEASRWRVCAGVGVGQRISVICDVGTNLKSRTPENEANARLIAAAPDLLAALKGVLRVADRDTIEFDAARAAIAKAIGNES